MKILYTSLNNTVTCTSTLYYKNVLQNIPLNCVVLFVTAEGASLESINNAVRSFVHHTVMRCYHDYDTDLKMVCLNGRYCEKSALEKFIASLESYRV